MNKFFARNLTTSGRVVRAVGGIILIGTGLAVSPSNGWICTLLVISGGFTLYEGARGWCLMRACGIKTKI